MVMKRLAIAGAAIFLSFNLWGQSSSPQLSAQPPVANTNGDGARRPATLTPGQKFALDAVNMAVALPQSDQQDRLRVLASAVNVVSPADPVLARKLSREGLRIESELIEAGQKPAVSVMSGGRVDCSAALEFVENLPPASLAQAEQSLIGAVTRCPKQTLDPASRKLDAALEKKVHAPRAMMAAMMAQGTASPWTQTHAEKVFSSLPDPKDSAAVAQDFSALYAALAGDLEKSLARKTGLQLLDWLAKIEDSPRRSQAVRTASAAMQQALGEQEHRQAMESDAVANMLVRRSQAVQSRQSAATTHGISVLAAMASNRSDQSDRLRELPAPRRAREAAANGFASAQAGDKHQAAQYFDIAFSAIDEAWEGRASQTDAAALVQEVGEAAAQSGSLDALERAQKLHDSPAQAIAMLAVARVVAAKGVIQ